MNKNDLITDLQQAKGIIKKVGELYQIEVLDKLYADWYSNLNDEDYQKKAKKVIFNMYQEYVLNVANVLWKDKFEKIPSYLKEW